MDRHTILGANGVIAKSLAKELSGFNVQIRQVSRKPARVNQNDELKQADLLDAKQTEEAVAGSAVVYLTAGLQYKTTVWQQQWPVVMRNTIQACSRQKARLVFFDNVYSYGLVRGPMTEETPYNPISKKGEIRARIATDLMQAVKAGDLEAMIVRAADFYGPGAVQSLPHSGISERLLQNKTPQWIGDVNKVHSFTYTPDAARSVAVLANTPGAYNQVWHALTSQEKMTGKRFVEIACAHLGKEYKVQAVGRFGLRVLGLFIPVLREFGEMMYQYEEDYFFDSSKLEKALSLSPTTYEKGIPEILVRNQ